MGRRQRAGRCTSQISGRGAPLAFVEAALSKREGNPTHFRSASHLRRGGRGPHAGQRHHRPSYGYRDPDHPWSWSWVGQPSEVPSDRSCRFISPNQFTVASPTLVRGRASERLGPPGRGWPACARGCLLVEGAGVIHLRSFERMALGSAGWSLSICGSWRSGGTWTTARSRTASTGHPSRR